MEDGRRFAHVEILSAIRNDYQENGDWNRARFTIKDAMKTAFGQLQLTILLHFDFRPLQNRSPTTFGTLMPSCATQTTTRSAGRSRSVSLSASTFCDANRRKLSARLKTKAIMSQSINFSLHSL